MRRRYRSFNKTKIKLNFSFRCLTAPVQCRFSVFFSYLAQHPHGVLVFVFGFGGAVTLFMDTFASRGHHQRIQILYLLFDAASLIFLFCFHYDFFRKRVSCMCARQVASFFLLLQTFIWCFLILTNFFFLFFNTDLRLLFDLLTIGCHL